MPFALLFTRVRFEKMARETDPVNCGSGRPDLAPPDFMVGALKESISELNTLHQYTREFGHPRLVKALARMYSRLVGREIDAEEEVVVTVGAQQALYCTIFGMVNPGDEVIVIEPFFDGYETITQIAEGVPVYIPLRPPQAKDGKNVSSADWVLDPKELESKFNEKTKMIVLNTPHNPTGKVFSRQELEVIANLCKKHDVICLSDEVYEWLVFGGAEHVRMCTLPGMWERTITVGSAGKAFNITGWKVGWAYGERNVLRGTRLYHQSCRITLSTLLQEAVAIGIELETDRIHEPTSYWKGLCARLQQKRDRVCSSLSCIGMTPTVPQGGYFIMADFSNIASKADIEGEGPKDERFATWLCRTKKLLGIPPSSFYGPADKVLAQHLIRFCFMREDSTLHQAIQILNEMKTTM
ncbi:unnamed protein product [Ixodes pacificus]